MQFYCIGGGSGEVQKHVSIWCDHHLPYCSATHLLHIELIRLLTCGLWNAGPLLFNGWCEVAGYWQELENAVVYADPEHPKHAQWVTCSVSMLAMQELGCFQLPGIVYRSLQHAVMVVDEWHNNGPQDLITVSLCIQNAINRMHLCSLSITYACPYHNPTATMGHSIHNVDISKPLTPHNTIYTVCHLPCTVKIRDSSMKRTPLQNARCHRM